MAKAKKKAKRGRPIDPDKLFAKQDKIVPRLLIREQYEKLKNSEKSQGKPMSWAILAKRAGMANKNNIAKWMDPKENSKLTFRTLKLISAVFGCAIQDLIKETRIKDRNEKP